MIRCRCKTHSRDLSGMPRLVWAEAESHNEETDLYEIDTSDMYCLGSNFGNGYSVCEWEIVLVVK
jgi:hypothetical protein